ncbi:MAG: hypothetical protein O2954_09200 [bacterium]|nr:hypothetical protein [bacterium]
MKHARVFPFWLIAGMVAWLWIGTVQHAVADEAQAGGTVFVDEDGDGMPDGQMNPSGHSAYGPEMHNLFIDEDGDGVNDLTQDADKDGIPNGRDSDYLTEKGIVTGRGWMGHGFVDEDGDGVNDLTQDADGDGIPNGLDVDYALPEGVAVGTNNRGYGMGHFGGFVDEDGDGVNDLTQDADKDGIPNGMDADYVMPEGIEAGRFGGGHGRMGRSVGFVDEDGDGINDLMLDGDHDGIPNGMDADYALPEGVRRGRFGGGHGMGHFNGFIDEDGDGVNDLMQDADKDGIPNGMDTDYVLPPGLEGGGHGGRMGGMMGGGMGRPVDGAGAGSPSDGSDFAQQGNDNAAQNAQGQQNVGSQNTNGGMMGSGQGMGPGMQDTDEAKKEKQKGRSGG